MTGPLQVVTVVVGELDRALAAYRHGIGLEPGASGRIATALADSWAQPALTGRRWVELTAAGDDRPGAIRVIELPGVEAPRPLTTLGWAAAELVVADADAAASQARAAGLAVLAEPAPVGSGGGLRAVQVAGPAGEALYLTEVRRAPPGFDLPSAIAPVGRVFIAVLASADLTRSRATLERELAARRVTDHELPVRAVNYALGLPSDTRHRVSSVQLAGASAIETDQYPASVRARPEIDGVTGGIVAVTVHALGPPRVLEVPAAGGALLELGSTRFRW
ncbi:VOC family protein [Micromonospora carbonacea]|uniref:VOC domain-containing protein n=1 Tax=Micromonospora carbonacea TaxID=47853 RepID=A0A1C4V7Z5_9ACTN|nr:VOC family protein [Micromonospora carbonacea]SCE80133.1 hypothetical protein GA0070563_102103 [Micromonospora carbonacea]